MLSLFKKARNTVNTEVRILENFVHMRAEHLRIHTPKKETVAHIPGQSIQKENTILTYSISKDKCEALKKCFTPQASFIQGESEESLFGKILHEGKEVGFYLGKSYQYQTYWARFWLE